MRRNATLHAFYLQQEAHLLTLPWLERDGYAAYRHHVPTAHAHLEAILIHPSWSDLFTNVEVGVLHRRLDQTDEAVDELRRLPTTLIHGDFHIHNLGFDQAGKLVILDWAHVGIAPLGCDVATLVSLYHAFGGSDTIPWSVLEHDLVAEYAAEIARIIGHDELHPAIEHACQLWHRTWGLHLRLGPGLEYLLGDNDDNTEKRAAAADVYEGCARTLG